MTRIVFISDTHGRRIDVPPGDMLVHCGDGSRTGRASEILDWCDWMRELPHAHKVFIAGNHDFLFERDPRYARELTQRGLTYLQDDTVYWDGLKIHGSPWQPEFYNWAFNLPRGEALAERWAEIPDGLDLLITHGPPHGILDRVNNRPENVGCADLMRRVDQVQPRIHAFGHIHEQHGTHVHDGTLFINAAICDEHYRPIQPPIVVDLPPDGSPVVVTG